MANDERKTPEVVVQHAPRFDRREAARMAVERALVRLADEMKRMS